MANGIQNAGVDAPKKIKVRGKEISVTPTNFEGAAEDFAKMAKLGLSFLPGSGEAIAAEEYFESIDEAKEKLKEKDYAGAAGSGLMSLLLGAGTLPVIGPIMKGTAKGAKVIYQGGKDAYRAFRNSRLNSDASDIVQDTAPTGTDLVKINTGTEVVEARTAAPVGDIDEAEMLTFSEGTPFYSKGLEVVDNVDYANYQKTGGIERIRPTLKTKDKSLTAPEWKALFKKNNVTNQELKESGVLQILDAYSEVGERVPSEVIRDQFLTNPAFRIKVSDYGGGAVDDLANIRAQSTRLVDEARDVSDEPFDEMRVNVGRREDVTEAQLDDLIESREMISRVQSEVMDMDSGANMGVFLENEFDKIENLYQRMNNNGTFERFPLAKKNMDRFIKEFGEGGYLNPSIRTLEGPLKRTKHEDSGYTLSGGTEYREKVLVGPEIEGQPVKVFTGHFSDKNPVAHIRYDTRTRYDVNGNDMNDDILFIQEMQSDLHQRARKYDYNPNPNIKAEDLANKLSGKAAIEFNELMRLSSETDFANLSKADIEKLQKLRMKYADLIEKQTSISGAPVKVDQNKMPFSPFQDDEYWGDYGIKLMAKQAYDEGKSWIAIAPADMVSKRDSSTISGLPAYGNAMFYGASDGKSLKAGVKSGGAEKTVKKGVVPKIFERLSKLDPNRPPLEVKTIYIQDGGGSLKAVYAMEIDDRFDTVFPMYKNQGGIVSLLRK